MSLKIEMLLSEFINLHPKYIDLSLKRIKILLHKLDNPHLKLPPTIHIAGTNGKGSTLSYLRYIMMEKNLKVHVYTSPHLQKFNERIITANKEITNKKLYNILQFIKKINAGQPITFFEITTVAAFYIFSKEKADLLLLETGLGGRLDATNIVKNTLINIITPIGIDHQDFLGKSIYKIINEKLGIIKPKSNIIISKQKSFVTKYIKRKIHKKNNSKLFYGKNFKIIEINKKEFVFRFEKNNYVYKIPKLLGNHQIENASTAIATILNLNKIGFNFSKKNINDGIKKTIWPGRLERGKLNNIPVYLDGAHNTDGALQLLNFFKYKKFKCWLIVGMLNNKDIDSFLRLLKPVLEGVVAIKIPNEKNSYETNQIATVCKKRKILCIEKENIKMSNKFLVKEIKPKRILVSGSLYLIGKIRKYYLK